MVTAPVLLCRPSTRCLFNVYVKLVVAIPLHVEARSPVCCVCGVCGVFVCVSFCGIVRRRTSKLGVLVRVLVGMRIMAVMIMVLVYMRTTVCVSEGAHLMY